MKKIFYSRFIRKIMKVFFSIFYDKKYLTGKYFDEKIMGYYWAFRGLKGRIFGPNRKIPWPVNPNTIVSRSDKLVFDIDDLNIFQTPGCYWQNPSGRIFIGRGTFVAPNVGIITTNHDIYDLKKHTEGRDVILGIECWIGMNAVILPGVHLGDHTIVAAGAVVIESFPEGYCVLGGVPAQIIKTLDKSKFKKNIEDSSHEKTF